MSYVALYRKYRPQTFSDVVGQDHIVNLLNNSVKQKKISHAYLFSGGRGTGKTTVARILAKEVGCNDEDIIEIDAASNRGIDEVRELREAVRTAPFSSPYKVYIVDEAHMLTKEAANALLKTLEEPPAHVIFILATTDPEKLPVTIVSRCQKIAFKNPTNDVLSGRLIHVAGAEGFDLENHTAELIAIHGKGSYRDALGVLEQVIAFSKGNRIEHESVSEMLGIPDRKILLSMVKALCNKDAKAIVKSVELLRSRSAIRTYDELIELLRTGLLSRAGDVVDDEEMIALAKEYPFVIGSKMILELLEKRHLILVSEGHSWTALEAILIDCVER